ncbi:hypothetical protein AAVH_12158 [Aphelenchoides avenae]|nr:hypothetical protein AAVH_12158 [Aphelenchus avenae]
MDPWQSAAGHDQQWAGGIDKYNEQLQLMIDVKEKLKLAHQRRNDDLQAAKRAFEEQLDRLLTQEWAGAAPAYAPQMNISPPPSAPSTPEMPSAASTPPPRASPAPSAPSLLDETWPGPSHQSQRTHRDAVQERRAEQKLHSSKRGNITKPQKVSGSPRYEAKDRPFGGS